MAAKKAWAKYSSKFAHYSNNYSSHIYPIIQEKVIYYLKKKAI